MDSVLHYQLELQRINETLESFQSNEDVDADNVSLNAEQKEQIEALKKNLLKNFKTES
jgi:hypothetical protein